MILTLALSVLGDWSYAGFLAEPIQAPAPAATAAPASICLEAEKPSKPPEPSRNESPVSRPTAPRLKPAAAPPPIPPAATLYRSTDASGQTWEHSDPAYLSSFVDNRNRWIASASPTTYVTYTSSGTSWFARRRSK